MAAAVVLLLPASAGAQFVTVNEDTDAAPGACTPEPGGCTLREAMVSTPEGTIVNLPAGDYDLTEGELPVGENRFLLGAGARTTTITATNRSRVISATDGSASVSRVTISNGNANRGGGIYVGSDASLNLIDSSVSGNIAERGGGIYSEGSLNVEMSLIANNLAEGAQARGGGLAVDDGIAELFDSTVSTNLSEQTGAGLWTAANVEMRHVTIAGNEALSQEPLNGAGIEQAFNGPDDRTSATHVLVADNFGSNCRGTAGAAGFINSRFSMSDDQTCNVDPQVNFPVADAGIGSLADNGGPTDTHELLSTSPAIDAAEPGLCFEFDQRGLERPQGEECDIGAYERVEALIVTNPEDDDSLCTSNGCSLREALDLTAEDGAVTLPAGTYELEFGAVEIARKLDLIGAGARDTTIAQSGPGRVLSVSGGEGVVVSGVTITGGDVSQAPMLERLGGGIAVASGALLSLQDSAVVDNVAELGGGIASEGTLDVVRSTIASNQATGGGLFGGSGGGVFTGTFSTATFTNSTISGNVAALVGGGIAATGTELELSHATVAGNSLESIQGLGSALFHQLDHEDGRDIGSTLLTKSLIGGNPGTSCAGSATPSSASVNNLTDDGTCLVAFRESLGLAVLGDYGGPTDTHALLAGSPALDAVTDQTCATTDQRLEDRSPSACDAGAFESSDPLPAGTLRVVATVINDDGGNSTATGLRVNVKADGKHVLGSPRPGDTEGRDYLLAPDDYVVSADAGGYAVRLGGACAQDGAVVVVEGQLTECVVTFDDNEPPPSSPPGGSGGGGGGGTTQPSQGDEAEQLPPPTAGEEVNAEVARGTVRIKLPGTNRFVELTEPQQLPVGTVVDTLRGRITLIAAGGQTGTFYDGIFRIGQGKGARPLTTLTLVEALSCPKAGRAVAAAKKKKRRLWGDGSGRFRTKGKHSAATVVGTKWLVEDRCTSTLTRVTEGRVKVRDFVKKKTVTVRAGKKYVARARKR